MQGRGQRFNGHRPLSAGRSQVCDQYLELRLCGNCRQIAAVQRGSPAPVEISDADCQPRLLLGLCCRLAEHVPGG
jgi:hypothetical protein